MRPRRAGGDAREARQARHQLRRRPVLGAVRGATARSIALVQQRSVSAFRYRFRRGATCCSPGRLNIPPHHHQSRLTNALQPDLSPESRRMSHLPCLYYTPSRLRDSTSKRRRPMGLATTILPPTIVDRSAPPSQPCSAGVCAPWRAIAIARTAQARWYTLASAPCQSTALSLSAAPLPNMSLNTCRTRSRPPRLP